VEGRNESFEVRDPHTGMLLARAITAANAQPGDPPFDVYIHAPSENGELSLVVRYHSNGTFELSGNNNSSHSMNVGGYTRVFKRTGRWWREADGKFCFQQNPTTGWSDTKVHCKPAGHLIGQARVPIENVPTVSR
jgi:hypothetical protein